jgi:hypothetical protein
MGSIIDLLALLDGWDYREVSGTITVQPNVINEVFAEKVPGWLIFAEYDSTDAFANITVNMPPETFSILQANLAELAFFGITLPLAQSLVLTLFNFTGLPGNSSGQGAAQMNLAYPLPLKKENTVHIQFTLDPGTTQASASLDYAFVFAQIYKPTLFQQSLKDLLNVKKLPAIF